jgi:DNA mismatch repair protein MutS2
LDLDFSAFWFNFVSKSKKDFMNQELRNIDWVEVLSKIEAFATSSEGKNQILNTSPLEPLRALQSVSNIQCAQRLLQQGLRPHMSCLDLAPVWLVRLKKKSVLKNLEFKDVRLFCLETLALFEVLSQSTDPWSQDLLKDLMNAERPLSSIDQVFTLGGEIRSDASEKLYSLYQERERLAREIQAHLDKLVRDYQMETYLQDKFVTTREGRWVVPVKSGSQHWVPGVIHGSSQTKQTVFIEPEKIIPINNRLRQADVEIEEEIERILTELSYYLHSLITEFEKTFDILLTADVVFAKGQFALSVDAKAFSWSESDFDLQNVHHPLLKVSGRTVVANSVHLDRKKSILLLSGPNAGGKTVLLKSMGLAAQMARCGLPLCAEETSQLPYFKNILVALGDSQSVDEELSTFAAHLRKLQTATQLEGHDGLILIDEICGSTDPEEGSALARSFIETYSSQNVFAVITSHLGPLKTGWREYDRVLNGSLEYDLKTGRPTYQFLSGISGDSLALQMAKRVGVNEKVISRAIELLSPSSRERLQHLEEIEQLKTDIGVLRDHLKKETQRAKQTQMKYEKLLEDFEREKEKNLEKYIKEASRKIDEAISLARVDETFKKHQALQEIKNHLPEIVKAKPAPSSISQLLQSNEDFGKAYPPGSKIFIPSLKQDGIVQSLPNSKGEVFVLASSMRLQLKWQDLKPPQKPMNPTAQILRQSFGNSVALQTEERVIDVRVKNVADALEEIEQGLDQATQLQEDRVKIIHGHGTEALKRAVRAALSRSLYVKKWKAGTPEHGGDGVTWVEMSDENLV